MPRSAFLVALLAATLLSACSAEAPGGGATGGGGAGGAGGSGGGGGGSDPCDLDGDGHRAESCGGGDCNDRNDRVNPGIAEACEGAVDENCDGAIDEGCDCLPGDRRSCWPGAEAARNVGACRDGNQSCDGAGKWTACVGAVEPSDEGETCDGVDQDCDGDAFEGGANACGTCGPEPREVCGNGLDDDCDGIVDPGNLCNVHCGGVDLTNPEPPGLACCFRDPDVAGLRQEPTRYSTTCVEWPSFPACASEERACLDLDGDPSTECRRHVSGARILCGQVPAGGGVPVESDGCGFETPCSLVDCDDRQNQPCYSGPPQTLGVGACRGGTGSCAADPVTGERNWTSCEGEVLPADEVCGNRVDDDCDGLVDEEDASGARCPTTGRCAPGATELCGNGEDDDCDGFADEGCRATSDSQACYSGPLGTRGQGACADGAQTNQDGFWSACQGDVLPAPERCGDGVDSDCDGTGAAGQAEDDGCCVPEGEEVCDGRDNDCDGLADEGVSSACGTCGEPCFVEEFAEPATCTEGSGRLCNRVEPDENDPDAFTLDDDKRSCGVAGAIYLSLDGLGQVAKLDTITGQKQWQVPSGGTSPSRTAIPCDGSVWVGNRGFGCENDPTCSNLVHISADGEFICRADITGIVRGVAIDGNGFVWAGTFNTNRVYKVDGSRVNAHPDGIPRCEIVDLAPQDPNEEALVVGVPVYGLAFDHRGILWTASLGGGQAARIDTTTLLFEIVAHMGSYGIAVDANGNAWFGGGTVHRVAADGPYVNPAQYEFATQGMGSAVSVAKDGMIWAENGGDINRTDPVTGQSRSWPVPAGFGGFVHGIAEDEQGRIWAPFMTGGYAARFDPVTETWDTFEVDAGQSLYTYSDMTGTQLRRFVARQGSWTQTWDALYPTVDWQRVDWTQRTPAGTEVEMYARFANSRGALDTTTIVCGPYFAPPADLEACPGVDDNRYAAFEFILRPNRDGDAPVVGDISLTYTR